MPTLSDSLPRSLRQFGQVTMFPRMRSNSGSTSHPCTRTPTKASKDEAKIGGYRHRLLRPHPVHPPTHPQRRPNTQAATEVAAHLRYPRTPARRPTRVTTSTHPSRVDSKASRTHTMTWSSQSERCIDTPRFRFFVYITRQL
jgi:hypothetical protein